MAKNIETETASDALSDGKSAGTKNFLIFLAILDVLAGGVFGYLKLFEARAINDNLTKNTNNLLRLRDRSEALLSAASKIKASSQQPVDNLPEVITKIAKNLGVAQLLSTSSPQKTRWKKSSTYEEVNCDVQYSRQEGYLQEDLLRLLTAIERHNSKVQIKSINMGQRDPGHETWRPLNMVVRVFTPTLKK